MTKLRGDRRATVPPEKTPPRYSALEVTAGRPYVRNRCLCITRRRDCRRSDERVSWACRNLQARVAAAGLPVPPASARAQTVAAKQAPSVSWLPAKRQGRPRMDHATAWHWGRRPRTDRATAWHWGLMAWETAQSPAAKQAPSVSWLPARQGLARPSAPGTRALAPRRPLRPAPDSPSPQLSPAVAAPRAREARALGPRSLLAAANPDSSTTTGHRPMDRS